MISKGTTHDSGGRLARYLITGKDGERAELYDLRGFASPDIVEAFRSVHVMAAATKCEQPFFHVQVRCPEGETLSTEQWEYTADRIERMLGLKDQPRAIAFHIEEKTGERHMHVAFSRIDDETLTAKPLPFWKDRLKKVSRELELHFGLTLVPNERESSIKYAPTRAEEEQARRLGLDVHEIRQTIRDCFERSDCGRSFVAALAEKDMTLANGERRDFVVIDRAAGGIHALGKRILDVSAAQTRARLADLDRETLPTVEQAREQIQMRAASRKPDEPVRDRDRDEMKWQDAVAKAAIEKEKVERRFVEPDRPAQELHELERQAFRDLSAVGDLPREPLPPPHEDLGRIEKQIWIDFQESGNARAFAAALGEHEIALACVTKEEADRSHREAAFAKAVGNYAPRYREGAIVAVAEPGLIFRRAGEPVEARQVYRLNARTTGQEQAKLERFLKPLQKRLQGLDATKEMMHARAADRAAQWDAIRLQNATTINADAPKRGKVSPNARAAEAAVKGTAGKAVEAVAQIAGAAIEMVGDMFGATEMTPERIAAAVDAHEKTVAQSEIDLKQFRSDADYRRQIEAQEAQKIEAERQRSYYVQERERQR